MPGSHHEGSHSVEKIVYSCAACGAKNRIPRDRVFDDPTCGACRDKVFPREPVAVSDASWRAEVDDSPIPVLVDFWAPWCAPCRAVAPVLTQIAHERAGRLKVAKLDTEENRRTAAAFGIRSIPTMILFKGGRAVSEQAGALPKHLLDHWLERTL